MLTARIGRISIWCTDRNGGVSVAPFDTLNVGDHVGDDPNAVAENRRLVAAAAELPPPKRWVWMQQVHGSAVHWATDPTGDPPEADAAVTAMPFLPLAVLTADCAPVVIACDDAVGVVHAGHRGLLSGVLENAVHELRVAGAGEVRAFLGPCIRVERYEFGADDLARLVEHLGPHVAGRTADGKPALDIPAGVRAALESVGVDSLDDSGVCTSATPEFFSYRRDGVTGRQVTIAMLT